MPIFIYRYTKRIANSGSNGLQANPEVFVDVTRPKSILKEQIYNLKIVSGKLKNAYNGLDVEWIDIGMTCYLPSFR